MPKNNNKKKSVIKSTAGKSAGGGGGAAPSKAAAPPKKMAQPKHQALSADSPVHSTGLMARALLAPPLLLRPDVNPKAESLAASLAEKGQMEPGLVVPLKEPFDGPQRFRFIGGYSRFSAIKNAPTALVTIHAPFASDAEEMLAAAELNENRGSWGGGKVSDFAARAKVISDLLERMADEGLSFGDSEKRLLSSGFTKRAIKIGRWYQQHMFRNGWSVTDERLAKEAWFVQGSAVYVRCTEALKSLASFAHGDPKDKKHNQRHNAAAVDEMMKHLVGLSWLFHDEIEEDDDEGLEVVTLRTCLSQALETAFDVLRDDNAKSVVGVERSSSALTAAMLSEAMENHGAQYAKPKSQGGYGDPAKDQRTSIAFRKVLDLILDILCDLEKQEKGAAAKFLSIPANVTHGLLYAAAEHGALVKYADSILEGLATKRKNKEEAKKAAEAEKAKAAAAAAAEPKPGAAAKPGAAKPSAAPAAGGGAAKQSKPERPDPASITLRPSVVKDIAALDRQGNPLGLPEWEGKLNGETVKVTSEEATLAEVCEIVAGLPGIDLSEMLGERFDERGGVKPAAPRTAACSKGLADVVLSGLARYWDTDGTVSNDDRDSAPRLAALLEIWRSAEGKKLLTSVLAYHGIDVAHLGAVASDIVAGSRFYGEWSRRGRHLGV